MIEAIEQVAHKYGIPSDQLIDTTLAAVGRTHFDPRHDLHRWVKSIAICAAIDAQRKSPATQR